MTAVAIHFHVPEIPSCSNYFAISDFTNNKHPKFGSLGGDKVSMLTHNYPHKPLRKIEVTICKHQADSPFYVWPVVWSVDLQVGHTWYRMSLLRPGVIKQHKPNQNSTVLSALCIIPHLLCVTGCIVNRIPWVKKRNPIMQEHPTGHFSKIA